MQSKRNGNERTVTMSPLRLLASLLLSAGALVMGADASPDQLRDQGFEALKAAQADEAKIVDAARLLAQAAEAYEKAGNENAATELNSYLYWCKKKMTLQQMDTFIAKGNGVAKAAVAKMEAVEKKVVKPEEAAIWLAKADGFAEASKDPFLSAVRYFEVADRFIGSQESLIAQRKSLDLMGKAKLVQAPPQQAGSGPFHFGSWDVTLPKNQAEIVDAGVDKWWFRLNGNPLFSIQEMPPYLTGCKLIQQPVGHPWLEEVKSNRPFAVYVAVRLQMTPTSISMSERSFIEMVRNGGWKQTGGTFVGQPRSEPWVWRLAGKTYPAGSVKIDNPFAGTSSLIVVFFIQQM